MKKYSFIFYLPAIILLISVAQPSGLREGVDSEGKTLWSFSYFGRDDFFYRPSDMAFDGTNQLIYIADYGNDRVVVFDTGGKFVRAIGKKGQGPGDFSGPTGLCVMEDSRLAVADYGNNRIQIFSPGGEFQRAVNTKELRVADILIAGEEIYTLSSFGASGYHLNMALKEDSQPLVQVLDFDGNVLRRLTTDAYPETQPFIRAIKHRVSMAIGPEGRLYCPFFAINMVYVFDKGGEKVDEFERSLPFKPTFPQLLQQRSSGEVIQMSAKTDMVSHSARMGEDGKLYILTYAESFDKLLKERKNPEEMPPIPMRLDVLDPRSHRLLRTIDVDPTVRAFVLLGENRLAYIHEDAEGELVFKCVEIGE
jgi:hypothetical protein